jgi:hypothetical protein
MWIALTNEIEADSFGNIVKANWIDPGTIRKMRLEEIHIFGHSPDSRK